MYKTISRERNFFILILSSVCVILPIADLVFFLTGDFSIKSIIFFILSLIPITAFWIILRLYKKADKENVRHHKVAERLYKTFNDGKDTELSDLEGFSDTLQTSLEQLKLNIAQLNLIDRDVHLIRLLKGPDQDLELILEKLKDYEVNFPHDGFLLMCFKMDKVEKPIHYETRDKVIKKSIIACLDDDLDAIVVDLEDYYACIVNYPFTEDEQIIKEFKEKVGKFAERAFNKLEEEFSIFISATVSEFHQGIYKLPKTYKEVTGLFEYKKITNNDKRLIFYTDYYISHESWYKFGNTYHKFDEVRKLITSIQVSDFLNAKSLIAELFDNDYSRQYPSLLLARCRKFGIIDAAINAMGLLKNDLDEDFLRELDPTTKIVNCPSYNDLERTLNEIFDAIINYIAEKNKELPPAWFENTMTYIEKHYNDPEINVSAIADHFDINSAYYARVFKKYTGISPLDYIHKLRMKSAKELMGKGLSVKDAASIVGYGNPLTMSRAFKRYEGLTPGSFVKTVVKLPDKLES